MPMIDSIMSVFRNAAPAQVQQYQQNELQNQQPQNQPPSSNNQVPNQSAQLPQGQPQGDPNAPKGEQTPEDMFKDLFTINPTQPSQQEQPLFNLDPKQFSEQIGKMNFTNNLPKELLGKIAAGGEEAGAALLQALNQVGQNAFAQAAQFSLKSTESGIQKTRESFTQDLPNQVRQHLSANSLYESNPSLRDPGAQLLIDGVHAQITQKFPNATVQEVNDMVKKYVTEYLPGKFGTPQPTNPKGGKSGETDWSGFLADS